MCIILSVKGVVAKRLRQRIANPSFTGSNPVDASFTRAIEQTIVLLGCERFDVQADRLSVPPGRRSDY